MDEVIQSSVHFQEHTGVLTHKQTQPTEKLILDRNAKLRDTPGAIRDFGEGEAGGAWGRMEASIPNIIFEAAIRDGYDLMSTDAKVMAAETRRFLATPIGKACMVHDSKQKYFNGN
jgi:hypothetical protein